ncbi:hypothetical protein [Burkholderia ubonensis]|uniref:hypothetical protein n=1 Tax=Burkholderia ubonensis TaxID=101571 RepID=UPI000AD3F451|nr:hypothetical protein [Burkholderia ubonensis]
MADTMEEPAPNERVSTYLYFCSLYFITVGVLYLWGYWSTFNVNILEYLSLADIVKSTAYPIASALIFFAIGAVLGEFLAGGNTLPPGGGRNTSVGRFLRKISPVLIVLYVLITLAVLQFGPVEKWHVLPILFAIPVYLACKQLGIFQSVIPDDSPRSIVVFLMATIPTFAYGLGRINADAIFNGVKFQYVLAPTDIVGVDNQVDPARRPRYLGHTGDFLFFFDPTKGAVAIAKFEATKTLELKQVERQRPFTGGSASSVVGTGASKPASVPRPIR